MSDIEVLRVLGSTLASNGTISLQVGDPTSGKTVDDKVQQYSQPGIACRPGNPNPGQGGSEVVVIKKTGADIAIAGRDGRYSTIVGNLDEGETCVYAPGSTAYCVFKNDGSVSMGCNAGNDPDGTSHYAQISPDGFYVNTQWGTMRLDSTGFHVATIGGAKIDAGSMQAPGLSLIGADSYAAIQAATVAIETKAAMVGGGTGVADNAAKCLPLEAYLTALNTALATAIAAAGAAGKDNGVGATTAAANFTAAMGTAVTTLKAALPSSTGVT